LHQWLLVKPWQYRGESRSSSVLEIRNSEAAATARVKLMSRPGGATHSRLPSWIARKLEEETSVIADELYSRSTTHSYNPWGMRFLAYIYFLYNIMLWRVIHIVFMRMQTMIHDYWNRKYWIERTNVFYHDYCARDFANKTRRKLRYNRRRTKMLKTQSGVNKS